jgi:hypothetical protein
MGRKLIAAALAWLLAAFAVYASPLRTYANIPEYLFFSSTDSDDNVHSVEDSNLADPPLVMFSYRTGEYGFTKRAFITEMFNKVACWPSSGGVWIKRLKSVELDYLGLSRFDDTERSSDQAEEDSFCAQFRKTGAKHYLLPPAWYDPDDVECKDIDACAFPNWAFNLELAHLKNGSVWFLDMEKFYKSNNEATGLYNVFNMEEKAIVLQRLGGTFCATMADCPETAELVK